VHGLSDTLAQQGFATHLVFVGDPALPAVESHGKLVLHRWGQWISAYHPAGVYDGEWGKVADLNASLPPFLIEQIVEPAARSGIVTVVMGEDWQIAGTMLAISAQLGPAGLSSYVVPLWTANNTYGFDGLDFIALSQASGIATVSRYMKHLMHPYGVDALVTPNGITSESLVEVPLNETRRLRDAFATDIALFKIGRFNPDKRWFMAVESIAVLKQAGLRPLLLMRGDKLAYGHQVLAHAHLHGLKVEQLTERFGSLDQLIEAISTRPSADVLNLTSFLPDSLVPVIYAAVDGVLANSGHEPFGLVGLEVMAAGGLAFVGSTGEDYAESMRNSVVLDTEDPFEIVVQLRMLQENPDNTLRLKRAGRETARAYLWPEVLKELLAKLEYVALTRGVEPSL
jgi:glycosyltransferase involved in cell wall biosynthesis